MKRILSVILSVVFALSLTTAVGASTGIQRISNVDEQNYKAILADNAENGLILLNKKQVKSLNDLEDLDVFPGAELKIYLTGDMFLDRSGNPVGAKGSKVTLAQLRSGSVAVRRGTSQGTSAIASFGLASDKQGAYIKLKFVDNFVSTKRVEYGTRLYLDVNKKRKQVTEVRISGSIANDEVEVYEDDEYVDLSGGMVAVAVQHTSNIEVDLGNDVIVRTRMFRGKKYYGVALTDVTKADEVVLGKYPGIDIVYTLKTIGLSSTANKVRLEKIGDKSAYVYNSSGVYLGTADKNLPYSTKYYVSRTKYDKLVVGQPQK